ncbi:methyltransferase domain-containing protein [Pararobbsia alpina]|uniref:Glycosyltransferase 2-like domain-containing protein n=1 Tax=Pararobbsia alpina TaxID=621374 RepID=A0A6S7AV21_9BURK|nr:methyltransferase domain-containing protein [Pararobbsia alpina]CAB3778810.1 hypothetical protein LMG28138_00609 [Pararobbsia alpina]
MATVSILIPAFKSEYISKTLSTATYQTFEDIEILVGDDTRNGDLRDIVGQFKDPRIKYFHHGFQDGIKNCRQLWLNSTGQYVKWLYDDDVLMPTSVEALVAALRAHPNSALAFHGRVFIDHNETVTFMPPPLLPEGQMALVDRPFLVTHLIGKLKNFVGEPSNTLLNKSLLDLDHIHRYRSGELQFLVDVAMYLYASERAPIVAVGGYLSGFRQHSGQNSNAAAPAFSAGLFEWELFIRGEASAGNLSGAALMAAKHNLSQMYAHNGASLPEIQRLQSHLDEIGRCPETELFASPRFQSDMNDARAAVKARVAAKLRPPADQQPFCPVCERHVAQWLPHPHWQMPFHFLTQVEGVGSILDKHICPSCRCNDRDRHVWLYLTRAGLVQDLTGKRVLHIAPETALEPRLRALNPLEYIGGDLFPRVPAHRKVNVETLDFPNDYFDLIICNHVLEHVGSPETALAEFHRCLVPGGHLVAQTPYAPKLRWTMELIGTIPTPFAVEYFGQDDHVRLFGADIVDYFHAAGLKGDLLSHESMLGDFHPDVYGCNGKEPFFLFAKEPLTTVLVG